MKSYFSFYHPLINILYFVIVCIFTLSFINPIFIGLNIICAFASSIILLGRKKTFANVKFGLMVFAMVLLLNPLLNARGNTVLFRLFSHPVTFEAVAYGLCTGGTLLCMFLWIGCFGSFFDFQKLMYLTGGFMQKTTLMLSMAIKTFKDVRNRISILLKIRKLEFGDEKEKENIKSGFKTVAHLSTSLLGWTLEDSIDTVYSMKARGYGVAKRTNYKHYRFRRFDILSVLFLVLCFVIQLMLSFQNAVVQFFPVVEIKPMNPIVYISYCLTLLFPALVEIWGEVRLWH